MPEMFHEGKLYGMKFFKMGEAAWAAGTMICAFGVALCTKAGFGLSMMAAPPYIVSVYLRRFLHWYTQGISEFIWQFCLMALLCLCVKRIRLRYLISYGTTVLFGSLVDMWIHFFTRFICFELFLIRVFAYVIGVATISLSVALVFRSYIPPQIAECFVMELAASFNQDIIKVKQVNDILCLLLSVVLALFLTGQLTGIGAGTVIFALCNAKLIQCWSRILDAFIDFTPVFPKLKDWVINRL